ncbi:hypothetical protein TNCT_28301 [Trichonephila clavata]|uniref:Uncharacterized protein n=1 Tax=Trichonephila clavata TaxID=2740835 RepID=A0A8X6IKA1_TRICU|nr:hypothetical protein TNCT_28301 [Trichonephila clavata]
MQQEFKLSNTDENLEKGRSTHPRHSENSSQIPLSKVLGIPWNAIHDYFTNNVKDLLELNMPKPISKGIVLQSAGSYITAKIKRPLTSQEVDHAENWLIRSLQEKEFREEMLNLLAGESIPVRSKLTPLNVFLSEINIMSVGGRLVN